MIGALQILSLGVGISLLCSELDAAGKPENTARKMEDLAEAVKRKSIISTELSALLEAGKIVESPRKKILLKQKEKTALTILRLLGFNQNVKELMKEWAVFEDNKHMIISGKVSDNDGKLYDLIFVIPPPLGADEQGNKAQTFLQIGNEVKSGEKYPENLIPFFPPRLVDPIQR